MLPLDDNEDLVHNLPSFHNTLLLIETMKNLPNHSLTNLDRRENESSHHDDHDSLIQQIEEANEAAIAESTPSRQKKSGCTCRKTNCLKRYCECFSSGKVCSEECVCCDCKNTEEHV